jgi:hypothetical protein
MLDQAGIMIAPINTTDINISIATGTTITDTYGSNITTKALPTKILTG